MAENPLLPLARAAVDLNAQAPEAFRRFLHQLGYYAELQVQGMLKAPSHEVLHWQGRAKLARTLCEDLERSPSIVNTAEELARAASVRLVEAPAAPVLDPTRPVDF